MTSPFFSPVTFALIAVISFAILVRLVSADTGTSTSFHVGQSINDFGGGSTSTSFQSVSTGGQVVSGTSTSSNFQLDTGYEYFDSFTPKSENWRWYDDEENETPSDDLEAENVAPSGVENDSTFKLRIAVAETAGFGQSNVKFKLQYSTLSDFSADVHNITEIANCTGGSKWCYAYGAGVDNAVISTSVISGADSCSGGVGDGCGTHNESGTTTSAFTQIKNTVTEYEFTIKSSGPASGTAYFFRLFDNNANAAVALQDGATYPSLSSGGGSLSFSISGVSSGTNIAGVTTDVDTTSTEVPFDELAVASAVTAAHRLEVSTNAVSGYEVYVFQSQGLLNEQGAELPGVTGTNPVPKTWGSGCIATSSGCFGYHTDESVLAGGSVRFAADDTFARFSQTLEEVAFSAIPAFARTTDVAYKIERRDLTAEGSYATNIAYIVVPVF